MTHEHCKRPATTYRVTTDGQTTEVHECDGCHKRRTPLVQPDTGAVTWAWMPKAGYCTACRHPIWRFASDPTSGQPVLLWPGPEVVSVKFSRPDGGFYQPVDYCPKCAPRVGAKPRRPITAGNVPLPVVACVERIPVAERYAAWFTDERRAFYESWSRDHLMLDDTQHAVFMGQWAADRAAIFKTSTRGSRGGDRARR